MSNNLIKISFSLNGNKVETEVSPQLTVLEMLTQL